MNDELKNSVLDKYTKICTCRVISRAAVKKAISEGADTLDKVINVTGACKGSCKGARCKYKIKQLLEESN